MLRQQLARKISANDLDAARSLIDKIDAKELIQDTKDQGTRSWERTESPFHEAALCEHPKIMELLIQKVSKIKGLEKISWQNERGETPLHLAAGRGNNAVVKLLLDNMPRKAIDALAKFGYATLHDVIEKCSEDTATLMLSRMSENSKYKVLHTAAEQGHNEVVKLLLNNISLDVLAKFGDATLRAVIEKCSKDTVTLMLDQMSEHSKYEVLRNAAEKGHKGVFELLLSKMSQKANETPLHTAARNGHDKVVELLLSEMSQNFIDAATDSRVGSEDFGYTALHLAAKQGSLKVVGLLLDKMSKKAINDVTDYRYTALHFAAENGHDEVVKLLLREMLPEAIDASTTSGHTALHLAAEQGRNKVVELLLDKMLQNAIDASTTSGHTVLHFAIGKCSEDTMTLILNQMSQGAVDASTNSGHTALHLAAEQGRNKVVGLLLDKMSQGAIDASTNSGHTALHLAAEQGRNKVVELLLNQMSQGAIDASTNSGHTALHLAAEQGHHKVVGLLLDKMSQKTIDAYTKDFTYTALHAAIEKCSKDTIELILKKMSQQDINASTKYGKTALHLAAEKGRDLVVELLLDKMSPKAITAKNKNSQSFLDIIMENGYATQEGLEKFLYILIDRNKATEGSLARILVRNDDLPGSYDAMVNSYINLKKELQGILLQHEYLPYIKAMCQQVCDIKLSPWSQVIDEGKIRRVFADTKELSMVLDQAIVILGSYKERGMQPVTLNEIVEKIKGFSQHKLKELLQSVTVKLALEEFMSPSKGDNAELFAKEVGLTVKEIEQGSAALSVKEAESSSEADSQSVASGYSGSLRLVEELIKYVKSCGLVTLTEAISNNSDIKQITAIIESKADVNAQQESKIAPIHLAVRVGRSDIVKVLLDSKADPFHADQFGNTALSIAVSEQNIDCVRRFLRKKQLEMQQTKLNKILYDTDEEDNQFYYELAVALRERNSHLTKILDLSIDSQKMCFLESMTICKILGQDVSELLTSDLID